MSGFWTELMKATKAIEEQQKQQHKEAWGKMQRELDQIKQQIDEERKEKPVKKFWIYVQRAHPEVPTKLRDDLYGSVEVDESLHLFLHREAVKKLGEAPFNWSIRGIIPTYDEELFVVQGTDETGNYRTLVRVQRGKEGER